MPGCLDVLNEKEVFISVLIYLDPDASILLALHKVITNSKDDDIIVTEEKVSDLAQVKESDQESTPEKDTPSPVTPETVIKRGSWTGNESIQSSPRHPKMLFKTKTLSALPLSNTKNKPEIRFFSSLKHRSLDDNYMKSTFVNDEETAIYFKLLFFACLCMLVWKHIWLIPVVLFFLVIHLLKRAVDYFGVWLFFENHYNNVMGKINDWWNDR